MKSRDKKKPAILWDCQNNIIDREVKDNWKKIELWIRRVREIDNSEKSMGFLEIKRYRILTRQNAKFAHKHLNREPIRGIRGGLLGHLGDRKLLFRKKNVWP